jgi:hypothetical protein
VILIAVCACVCSISATRVAAAAIVVRTTWMAASSVAWARGSIRFIWAASRRKAAALLTSGRSSA